MLSSTRSSSSLEKMLRKQGEFFPFGGTTTKEGQVSLTAADTGDGRPPSQEVIELLASGMRAQATELLGQ